MPPMAVHTTLTHDGKPVPKGASGSAPHLFLALECERPLAGPARFSLRDVDAVLVGRGDARSAGRADDGGERRLVLTLPDARVSSRHAVLRRALGRWALEDAGSKNGTWLTGRRIERVGEVADGDVIEVGHTLLLYRDAVALGPDDPALLDSSELRPPAPGLATLLPDLAARFRQLEAIAASALPVVINGESGTGKEVTAAAVHRLSGRKGAFVPVNCAALPATLVESELFGYRKGAFSGADEDRPGLVRSADGGTLFLDEIADLPLPSQGALLRVLQESEVVPVGATRALRVDLRVLCATQRDLASLSAEGRFRPDLYARLAGFTLDLPPLRDRRPDLGLLLATMLGKLLPGRADRVSFTPEAARALFDHGWPLNARELEQALAAAVVLAGPAPISLEHLPPAVRQPTASARQAPLAAPVSLSPTDEALREKLVALLTSEKGNVAAVARKMGKARTQIQRWLRRCGLEADAFRG